MVYQYSNAKSVCSSALRHLAVHQLLQVCVWGGGGGGLNLIAGHPFTPKVIKFKMLIRYIYASYVNEATVCYVTRHD